jgi:MFS family permease
MALILSPAVLVVALGYFVDIFDLTLFNMLRVQSLEAILVPKEKIIETGIMLLNCQMAGMLIGGIFWGVLGDKKGRLNVLFASILIYSAANIANAFVGDVFTYAILRFISGFGLAGELGAGITLIAELLPKEKRGLGTTMVATIGVFGATLGAIIVEHFSWSTCYIIGGSLGLLLLFLRIQVSESHLFQYQKIEKKHESHIEWGNFLSVFKSKQRFLRFYNTVMIGVPIWFIAGLVMAFSPELALEIGVSGAVTSAKTIGMSYLGLGIGDFLSGFLSQQLKSRKKSILVFLIMTIVFLVCLFTLTKGRTSDFYYFLCFCVGVGAGFWAIFVTVSAEQFGTNLRATVATSVPNFVRGSVIPMTLFFKYLKPSLGIGQSMVIVGICVFTLSFVSWYYLEETFHKDLKFLE